MTLDTPTAVENKAPISYKFGAGVFPNPGRESVVGYNIPGTTHVTIQVYNMLGQEVKTIVDDVLHPGIHTARWDGKNSGGQEVANGVYFIRIMTQKDLVTLKYIHQKDGAVSNNTNFSLDDIIGHEQVGINALKNLDKTSSSLKKTSSTNFMSFSDPTQQIRHIY